MTAAKPDIAPFDGVWTSALAAELAAVPQRVRTAVGLPDTAIQLLEMVVRGCRILLDDNDPRSLVDRVEDLEPMLDALVGGDAGHAQLDRFTQWSEQQVKDKLEHWVNRLRSPAGQAFLRRVMGTGRYDRIRQALTDDGVSQAANSLIEFIDRLLRQAFDECYVLQWASTHFPGEDRMTHVDVVNVVHPTTFARALCFVCAGDAPNEPYEPARMLADSLVSVRRAAEKLKLANADEATEVNTLRNLMAAVRGVMTFVMRFTWGLAHEERLDYLRRRFAIAS